MNKENIIFVLLIVVLFVLGYLVCKVHVCEEYVKKFNAGYNKPIEVIKDSPLTFKDLPKYAVEDCEGTIIFYVLIEEKFHEYSRINK